jgi:hypothetical protein
MQTLKLKNKITKPEELAFNTISKDTWHATVQPERNNLSNPHSNITNNALHPNTISHIHRQANHLSRRNHLAKNALKNFESPISHMLITMCSKHMFIPNQ